MFIGDNYLIVSKNKDIMNNDLLIHALSLFEHRINFNLYLILKENYNQQFITKLMNCIFYIIQSMEYSGSVQNSLHIFTSNKEILGSLNSLKNNFGKYADRLILKSYSELTRQNFIDDEYFIKTEYFSNIIQVLSDSIQINIPETIRIRI